MLGAYTKKVAAYGKRSHRYIAVSELPDSRWPEQQENIPIPSRTDTQPVSKPILSPPIPRPRTYKVKPSSPRASPKASHICTPKKVVVPRRPLVDRTPNLGTPIAASAHLKGPANNKQKFGKIRPFVDNPQPKATARPREEIVISDDLETSPLPARRRRNNRSIVIDSTDESDGDDATFVIEKPFKSQKRAKRPAPEPVVLSEPSDSEPDVVEMPAPLPPQPPKTRTGRTVKNPIIISDSESEECQTLYKPSPEPVHTAKGKKGSLPLPAPDRPLQDQKANLLHRRSAPEPKPRSKATAVAANAVQSAARPATPRLQRRISVSSIASDDTFSTSMSSMLSSPPSSGPVTPMAAPSDAPSPLEDLLRECGQTEPMDFAEFIRQIPSDALHGKKPRRDRQLKKIGEASYSEVFGVGELVLKIIPLNTGLVPMDEVGSVVDAPFESEIQSVMKEIVITRTMGQFHPGFIQLLSARIVQGKYPDILLNCWDEYDNPEQLNLRPDGFRDSSLFAVIVLPNGGKDLESVDFKAKTGWREAASIFWQVARTLGAAEELVHFEHRDLHVGQVLVKHLPASAQSATDGSSMDDLSHGVRATIIDLGLSRMDAGDGNNPDPHFTAFDDEIFDGKGDYQFDIYRMMRDHIGEHWPKFHPLTNVMWLHYLAGKLLRSKNLKPPSATGRKSKASKPTVGKFTEAECYGCLAQLENILGESVQPKKTRGKQPAAHLLQSTVDVLKYGQAHDWIN